MRIFKRKSLESIDRFSKAGYVVYQNNKLVIVRYYNKSGRENYLKNIGECFWMLCYGIISIIGFPFCLLFTLLNFIPRIYIKDGNLDIQEQQEREEIDKKMDELLKNRK